jgi:1,2-diacylglycerol 3-alpha-glucosyltransferase
MSDAVIAPSPKIKTLLKAYGVRKPIYVLPTGIRLQQFKRTKTSARKARALRTRLAIQPRDKVLLFVGRLGREKNIDFLLRAFGVLRQRHTDVCFVLVGEGPIRDQLQSLATRIAPANAAIFTGAVAHAEIASYYQAADVFLFSSLTDTQGIVVLEAIASGLPVVALHDEAFTLMVKDRQNGVLLRRDASARRFAGAVDALLQDQAQWRRFSTASIRIARRFSEEHQAQQLASLYKRLISPHLR